MKDDLPLIVTRADPGGRETVARARAAGLNAVHVPLFAAQALAWTMPDAANFDALLITSAQAPRLAGAGLERLADLPAYAVGQASADAARAAGLNIIEVGDSDGRALIDGMVAQGVERILWLNGRDHSDLTGGGANLFPLPCYAVDPLPRPPEWDRLIAAPAVVMAYSSRGAEQAALLAGEARARLMMVAISDKVARAAGAGWSRVAIAGQPTDADMVEQARFLCQKG